MSSEWRVGPVPHPYHADWQIAASDVEEGGLAIFLLGPRGGRQIALRVASAQELTRILQYMGLLRQLWQAGLRGDCPTLPLAHGGVSANINRRTGYMSVRLHGSRGGAQPLIMRELVRFDAWTSLLKEMRNALS